MVLLRNVKLCSVPIVLMSIDNLIHFDLLFSMCWTGQELVFLRKVSPLLIKAIWSQFSRCPIFKVLLCQLCLVLIEVSSLFYFTYILCGPLNMELDLQSLFGPHVHSCTHWVRPPPPPTPSPHIWSHIRGRYWSAKTTSLCDPLWCGH